MIDETGISSSLFLQYFIRSWLDGLWVVIPMLYVVRSLFQPITTVAQLGATGVER